MQEVKAIVQPFMLKRVLDALARIEDLPGVTISEVTGWGRSRALDAPERVHEAGHAFAVKRKLEIVVPDAMVDEVVETILSAAQTGKPGDGKVFVYALTGAWRIRTKTRCEEMP